MVYSDIEKHGLIGILPKKKRYGTKKDKTIVKEAVLGNKDFVQFALQDTKATYINEIIDRVVSFIVKCNQAYYEFG